jgi:hypothetical protein
VPPVEVVYYRERGRVPFVKQRSRVPESEMRRAAERMVRFKADPIAHRSVAEI